MKICIFTMIAYDKEDCDGHLKKSVAPNVEIEAPDMIELKRKTMAKIEDMFDYLIEKHKEN